MKKATALLLLLALFMSLAVPASATGVEPCYVCTHNYNLVDTTNVGVYFNPDGHKIKTVETYVCTIYANSYQDSETSIMLYSHSATVVTSSCNGTTQTITYYCSVCRTTYEDTTTCPAAPHTGSCRWLPG